MADELSTATPLDPWAQKAEAPTLPLAAMQAAILGQESGNRSDIGTSTAGAVGPGQIEPGTFAQYAMPGEKITNPDDNRRVNARILADYMHRWPNDPARVAVAYFSGPGNVAPPGSPTPYKHDAPDTNGKTTASYVGDVLHRLGKGGVYSPHGGANYLASAWPNASLTQFPVKDTPSFLQSVDQAVQKTAQAAPAAAPAAPAAPAPQAPAPAPVQPLGLNIQPPQIHVPKPMDAYLALLHHNNPLQGRG